MPTNDSEIKIMKMKKYKDTSRMKCNVIAVVATLVIFALYYYIVLPPINVHATQFWFSLILLCGLFLITRAIASGVFVMQKSKVVIEKGEEISNESVVAIIAILAILLIMIIGGIAGSQLFRAKTYSSLISVEEADFKTDMPETTEVTNIALMDTESARIIGNRTLGSLSDVVSQFEVSTQYSQINYGNLPKKVANLEYNGFFKWINNKNEGVPGYVMVDPVKNTAKYVELEKGLKYVESAFLGDDLSRKLRFSYPTKIFGDKYFEINEDGNPYYIVSVLDANAGLFGCKDVSEVIIFDPVTGDSEIYDVEDVPEWVDIVYDGDLASQKYNWKGLLSGGFINSIIGQKGCKVTTDDYGYYISNNDVWYYTGVTSVTSDKSNIGFVLTNARTGEYKYYSIVGAEEHSAISAAEGEVQEKGYEASFPCLINVADQATYIMVLKDNSGLVKQYALVNVENYSLVVTAETQAAAIAEYKRILIENNVISDDVEIIEVKEGEDGEEKVAEEIETYVTRVNFITNDGATYIYLNCTDGNIYKCNVADDETVMFITEETPVSLKAYATDTAGIYEFDGWEETAIETESADDNATVDENETADDSTDDAATAETE